mmetsp:Transcript_15946/g.41253  ORF Transcript_15946/g.41253 Transcript_15946/m.41253 type:complete len:93 (-) Transcript_15946:1832-2110(-)
MTTFVDDIRHEAECEYSKWEEDCRECVLASMSGTAGSSSHGPAIRGANFAAEGRSSGRKLSMQTMQSQSVGCSNDHGKCSAMLRSLTKVMNS